MHFVLIGPSGSGKTTVAQALADEFSDIPTISSGAIARSISATDPATSLALQQGAMAPEQAMRAAVKMHLERADATHSGWVLDGFPRSIEQLICLQQWTTAMPIFVLLELSPWSCLERLVARQRTDDNPDAIARRMEHFASHTQPMLDMLRGGGVLQTIAANRPVEGILYDLKESLR